MRFLQNFVASPAEFLAARGRFARLAGIPLRKALALECALLFLAGCLYAGGRFIPRQRYTEMLETQYGGAGAVASPELVEARKDTEGLRARAAEIRSRVIPEDRIGDVMENLTAVCDESGIAFGSLRRSHGAGTGGVEQVLLTLSAQGDFGGIARFLRTVESQLVHAAPRQARLLGGGAADAPLAARFVFGVVVNGARGTGA